MTERGLKNELPSSVVSVVSLGKSIHQFISLSLLRIINSLDSSSLKLNALLPSRIEVNSGKSIHHTISEGFTLKHNKGTIPKGKDTKEKCFQLGYVYSLFQSITISLFNSKEE